jgi:hypothetical protein
MENRTISNVKTYNDNGKRSSGIWWWKQSTIMLKKLRDADIKRNEANMCPVLLYSICVPWTSHTAFVKLGVANTDLIGHLGRLNQVKLLARRVFCPLPEKVLVR